MSDSGKPLRIDRDARSADPAEPAFVARPEGAPVYHGFPIIEESHTNGWLYGAITEFEEPEGTTEGDGFVVAPDGRRAGLVWAVGKGEISEVLPPDEDRWGVYAVWFPTEVRTLDDLVRNFRSILPELQRLHAKLFDQGAA